MAKGIKSITGNTQPEVGVSYEYQVASYYPNTVVRNDNDIKWKLYVQNTNGSWRELRGPLKTGKKAPFLLPERWLGKTMMIEAYMYNPEIKAAPGLILKPKQAKIPIISKVDLLYVDNTPGQVFSFTEKLRAKAECVNMFGKDIVFTLWEDSAGDGGHNSSNKKIESIKKPVNQNGIAIAEFSLTKALMMKAMEGEADIKQLEFYVTAEYYAHKKHPTNNVNIDIPEEIKPSVPTPTQPSAPTSVPSPSTPQTPSSTQNPPQIPSQNPTPNQVGTEPSTPVQPEEPIAQAQANGTINSDQPSTPSAPSGTSPTVINEVKIEDVIDAYFAKKEYTLKTGEEAGTFVYKFAKDGNNTATDAQKENIAKAILGKSNVVALKDKKEYTTLAAIKVALTENVYNKDKTVTFKTFKLGADFKKVNSAPLEDKLYLVAKTMLLDGKQATITIKEKDGIIKGSADAVLPVLEITEAQMAQTTATTGAVQGSQKTEFTGTVKDNMVKIPIHLRPESDDELKQWKEKLGKGKEDGTYTYKFANETSIPNGSGEKARIAGIILNNAKNGLKGNPKIEDGKTAYQEDIESVLTETLYLANRTITFKLYKKEKELLYLNVKAQGEKQHDKNFLKQEGAYFEVGKKCECEARIRAFMRTIRVAEGTGEYRKGTKEARNPELGYTTWFSGGGNNFSDLSTHPKKINCNSTGTLCSSASGAYQIMGWKFDELNGYKIEIHNDTYRTKKPLEYTESSDKAKKYSAKGFSEITQDRLCLVILKDIGAINSILNNNIEEAIDKAKGTWVSLPGATAGQPTAKMQETVDYYQEFLQKELSGKSNLHIKSGFLKEYNIDCQCQEENSGVCPDDRSQCFDYSDVVSNPRLNNQSNNVNKNRFHREKRYNKKHPKGYYHTGTDILTSLNTELKSLLCGEVTEALDTGGELGKIVTIKSKDKSGQFIWIRYCHLSFFSVSKRELIKHGEVFGKSGNTGNAIDILPQHYHVHIEASRDGVFYGGNNRVDPEQFMKTKFDATSNGNPIN